MGNIIEIEGVSVPIGSHEGKTIFIGADHRGYDYKNRIFDVLSGKGYNVIDVGTSSTERCDYPQISSDIGLGVWCDPYNTVGIGICGSGIGILIPASKYKGVYVARCLTPEEAISSRKHNNTNVLGIGADAMNLETTIETIDSWLRTPFYSDSQKEMPYLKRYVQTVKFEANVPQNGNVIFVII